MCPNKFDNHPSILCATVLRIEEGLIPYRYVLREDQGAWAVYRENMKLEGDTWKHLDFYWGHYYTTRQVAEVYFDEKKWK